jgi:hypothetical protein
MDKKLSFKPKAVMNQKDCSEYLGYSQTFFRELLGKGEIPFKLINNKPAFPKLLIDSWLLKGYTPDEAVAIERHKTKELRAREYISRVS